MEQRRTVAESTMANLKLVVPVGEMEQVSVMAM